MRDSRIRAHTIRYTRYEVYGSRW